MESNTLLKQAEQSELTLYQQLMLNEMTSIVDLIGQGIMYFLIIYVIFKLTSLIRDVKADKSLTQMVDEKLQKTIEVLDEKLAQY